MTRSKPRLFVHIGTGKTGTSFLQSAFSFNEKNYSRNNLSYPDLSENNRSASQGQVTSGNAIGIAASHLTNSLPGVRPVSPEDFLDAVDKSKDCLISSEWLLGCDADFLLNFHSLSSKYFETKFLVVVRDPADFIHSYYCQGLKTEHYKFPLEDHVDSILGEVDKLFRKILKIADLSIIINYDYHKTSLLSKFDELIFGGPTSIEVPFKNVNVSPNLRQCELLRVVNKIGLSDFSVVNAFLEGGGSDGPSLSLSNEVRSKIYDNLRPCITALNFLLPPDESIQENFPDFVGADMAPILKQSEVDFLSQLVAKSRGSAVFEAAEWILRQAQGNKDTLFKSPDDFDAVVYLLMNPDLIVHRVEPSRHYMIHGKKEGRRYK